MRELMLTKSELFNKTGYTDLYRFVAVDYTRRLVLLCSLTETYGRVFSLKLGSYKFVMASTPEAVYEMLVTKSADYAGRPQTYSINTRTLGKLLVYLRHKFRMSF